MNGFSAADMTDARAKGYQDRIEFEKESTPAAPGIDLEQFRDCVTTTRAIALQAMSHALNRGAEKASSDAKFDIDECDRLLALIDASPKGVTLHNDGSSEAQFIADSERLNCPACGGSGHVDDSHKGGSIALARAYGYLWHVNHPEEIPAGHPYMSADRAAVEARKELRDILTHEQRGEGINWVRQKLLAAMQATSAEVGHG